jgi:hypothetical protein
MKAVVTRHELKDLDDVDTSIDIRVTSIDGMEVCFNLPQKMYKTNHASLAASLADGFETPYEWIWNTWDGCSGLNLSKDVYTHESTSCGDSNTPEGGAFKCPMCPAIVAAFGEYLKLVQVVDDPPIDRQKRLKRQKVIGVQIAHSISNKF